MTKFLQLWRDNRGVIVFISLMFVFRSAVADWNDVPTGSMQPTIQIGDRILVNKMAYDLRIPFTTTSLIKRADPKRGDIVIFASKAADNRLVKRVIGVPGDVVAMQHNVLTINGKQLAYSEQLPVTAGVAETADDSLLLSEQLGNVNHAIKLAPYTTGRDSFNPVTVPTGHYLVLGDNRDNSADSRVIGFVPRHEIIGRAGKVLFSLDYDNYYLPRSERFLAAL
ncbi:MAG: signal peptidase I [Gammaproteobacteria bacterium]|nr:signal peptidase I [Gammaproteobacteria bacterium]MBU1555654.1 signal peptidase I [Gammaproteobacteria bacterium]MBU2068720.1 signal peptidase I [Gammaproteobacteria bacterium]MBU2185167.1 signal peptidase I [Gammaproteobacteria bacterium]MBU2205399.1 signal peptidase I [Gammaproteobacteria bacterium]